MPRTSTIPEQAKHPIFAKRLVESMAAAGYKSQDDLAKELNIQRQTISNYMNGARTPNTYTLKQLCKALGVSADYLIGLTDTGNFTANADVRTISEYTGLSNDAVEFLHCLASGKDCDFYLRESAAYSLYLINELLKKQSVPVLKVIAKAMYINEHKDVEASSEFRYVDIMQAYDYQLNENRDEISTAIVSLYGEQARDFFIQQAMDKLKDIIKQIVISSSGDLNDSKNAPDET